MQHAMLKLVALTAVAGIGVLVIVQAQRGLDDRAESHKPAGRQHPAFEESEDSANSIGLDDHQLAAGQDEPPEWQDDVEPVDARAKLGAAPPALASPGASRASRPEPLAAPRGDEDLDPEAHEPDEILPVAASAPRAVRPGARQLTPALPRELDDEEADARQPERPGLRRLNASAADESEDFGFHPGNPEQPRAAPSRGLSLPTPQRRALVTVSAEEDEQEEEEKSMEPPGQLAGGEEEETTDGGDDDAAFRRGATTPSGKPRAGGTPPPASRRPRTALVMDDEEPEQPAREAADGADDPPASAAAPRRNTGAKPKPDEAEFDDEPPIIERVAPKRRNVEPGPARIPEDDDIDADPPGPGDASQTPDQAEGPSTAGDGGAAQRHSTAPRQGAASRRGAASLIPEIEPELDEPAEEPPASPARSRRDAGTERLPRAAPRSNVTINKFAPATASLGQPMVYKIVVANKGPLPVLRVTVEDVLPDGMKIEGSIPQAHRDGKKLIWQLGRMEPGAEKSIAVRVVPQTEGTKGGVATVSFLTESSARSRGGPRLAIEALAPPQVVVGSDVALKFVIKNTGSADASGVVIRDVLPASLKHPEGDDLEFEIGSLPAGAAREVILEVSAAQAGRTVNRAIVTADGNISEEAVQHIDVTGPALLVNRSGPRKLAPGKQGKYTNTITNPGPATAGSVHVVETIPAGMEFVEASHDGEHNPARRTVTWNLASLSAGGSTTVSVTLAARARGAQIGVVRAYDAMGASGEAVGTTQVQGAAALSIDLPELPALVETGEQFTVPVKVTNRGTDAATSVLVHVVLPSGIALVSAKGPVPFEQSRASVPAGIGGRAIRQQTELKFAPVKSLDARQTIDFELVLEAATPGTRGLEVQVSCDQFEEPVRRAEATTIVSPEEGGSAP